METASRAEALGNLVMQGAVMAIRARVSDPAGWWCLDLLMNKISGEKVLSVGTEGGGADVYRIPGSGALWDFVARGSSMSFDENDQEIWSEWEKGPFPIMSMVMHELRVCENRLSVTYVHDEYIRDVIFYLERALPGMPPPHSSFWRQRFEPPEKRTPEYRLKEIEFLRKRLEDKKTADDAQPSLF